MNSTERMIPESKFHEFCRTFAISGKFDKKQRVCLGKMEINVWKCLPSEAASPDLMRRNFVKKKD